MDTKQTLPLEASKKLTWNIIITDSLLFLTAISVLLWLFFDLSQLEIVTVILGVLTAFISCFSFIKERKKLLLVIGVLGIVMFTVGLVKVVSPHEPTTENQTQLNKAIILNAKGDDSYNRGQYEQALGFYFKALIIFQTIGNTSGEGTTLKNIGEIYQALRKYDEALDYFNKALVIFQAIGDRSGEGGILNDIGMIHKAQRQYNLALDYFDKAFVIFQATGNTYGEGSILNNFGMIHKAQRQYNLALDYFNKALIIFQAIENRYGEGTTLNNIGGLYHTLGQYDLALDSFNKALIIFKTIGNKQHELMILNNIKAIQK